MQGVTSTNLAENEDEEGDQNEEASRQEEGPTPGLKLRHMLGYALCHVRHHNLGHTATCQHTHSYSLLCLEKYRAFVTGATLRVSRQGCLV